MTSLSRTGPARDSDQQAPRALAELTALTGVSRYTLAYAARTGALEAQRLGSQWVTTLAAVEAWLKGARHRPGRTPRRRPAAAPTPEHQIPAEPVT
jgi:hypothetical protein